MTRKTTARAALAAWTAAVAASAILGSVSASPAQSGKDLDSISAEKEPNLSCDQIIGQKAAADGISNADLAKKLKVSTAKVEECLGAKPAAGAGAGATK